MTGPPPPDETLGLAQLARISSDPARLPAVWEDLMAQVLGEPSRPGALLDLSTLLLASGNRDKGLELQAAAIAQRSVYRRPTSRPPALRLLALMTPGDFTANTPLDFLLEGSDIELICQYVSAAPDPAQAPDHDLAFLAIGQAQEVEPLLISLGGGLAYWPRPVLNNRPDVIAALTRDGVSARLAGQPLLLSPATARAPRQALADIAAGSAQPSHLAPDLAFPLIVRPVGTHAGIGMEKIANGPELSAYLGAQDAAEFYVSSFVDYSGPDGLYRKLRIVFIGGRPFLSHLAVSPRWMVHYLNADMEESAANREEEAQAMRTFDQDFALRHAAAFRALHAAFPLDYFGIDCAELPDGRLLVFEVDVAMIVHAMDPPDLYPYKRPAMLRLFAAFTAFLGEAARGGP